MYCLFCFPVTFSVNGNSISIEVLTGLNFKKWKEDFLFGMELVDVHIALTKDKPADITATSIETEKTDYAAWEKSNRICLLTMKKSIQEHLKSGLPADSTAKEMMAALEARNRISSNVEVGTLLQKLFNMKYDGTARVRDYILRMVDLKTKLQALNVFIPDVCNVHQALNTLPPDFGIIKTNYNSQDETWSVNDLIARVVAEEEKLKKEKGHMAYMFLVPTKGKIRSPEIVLIKVLMTLTVNLTIWVQRRHPSKGMVTNVSFVRRKVT